MEINLNKILASDLISLLNTSGLCWHTSQLGEDVVLWHMFKNKNTGFYIDIGAHHPTKYSNTFLLHYMRGWSGINIDADERAIENFNETRPKDINICRAVSDVKQNVNLYLYEDNIRAVNTIVPNMVQKQRNQRRVPKNEVIVQTETLENLLDQYLPKNQIIDILNVDCEGHDLNVLMSNNWDKYVPSFVCVEDHEMDFNNLSDNSIYQYMQSKGYLLNSHCVVTSIYKKNLC